MSVYFLDSSALVKRYVAETGSVWIQAIVASKARNKLIIARLTWVEVLSAFARRQREGSFAPADAAKAIRSFRYDLDHQYRVVELSRAVVEAAGQLVGKHPLRASDAIQLASALQVLPAFASVKTVSLVFLSGDDRLIAAAQAEGLNAENPNQHQ
ncbi:MAG: type II toxin-antitoxin system VapC family toxin [Chloroflexi bacterium]|nr:type II toxin-antitoxin system VapC family toxin [Chloroflexota bacterium]